jgi:DNA-binding transcriptional MerR regulator
MRIGELAKESGFPIKTLRYYDEIGLIRPARRNPSSGFREYGNDALDMLTLVKAAKLAGLNLTQIKKILVAARNGSACERVIPLLSEKLEEVEGAIQALQELRARLVNALKQGFPKEKASECRCPILDGLAKSVPPKKK